MWTPIVLPTIAAALTLVAPGLLIAWAAGYRLSTACATAPVFSIGCLALSGVASGVAGVAWRPWVAGTTTAVIVLLVLVSCRPVRAARSRGSAPSTSPYLAACIVSALMIGWFSTRMLLAPESISQTWDATFHLNEVRWILDSGHASSLANDMSGTPGFYPLAWHQFVALVMQLTGVKSIPLATNAAIIASSAVAWPLGAIGLAHHVLGRNAALIAGAVAAALCPAFPYAMASYGVLYPNLLAIALLPGSFIILLTYLAQTKGGGVAMRCRLAIPVLGSLAALALAHPNSLLTWLLAVEAMTVLSLVQQLRLNGAAGITPARWSTTAVVCALFALGWWRLRPPFETAGWPPTETGAQALGEGILLAPSNLAVIWIVTVPVVIGLLLSARSASLQWVGALHVCSLLLYVMASSMSHSSIRYLFSGGWYNDAHRLGSALAVTAVPLAALGATWCWDRFTAYMTSGHPISGGQARSRILAVPAIAAAVMLIMTQDPGVRHSAEVLSSAYTMTPQSASVSDDEYRLMKRIGDEVPADTTVAVGPYSGGPLLYAIAGVNTTFKHAFYDDTPDAEQVIEHLDEAAYNPEVCPALKRLGAQYALFLPGPQLAGRPMSPGFEHLDTASGFELVDSEGDAALYRITACAR